MNPLGPCRTILTQKVPGVWDSSELHSTGTLRSSSNGQYTPQLSSYLVGKEREKKTISRFCIWETWGRQIAEVVPAVPVSGVLVGGPVAGGLALVLGGAALVALDAIR